MKTICFNTIVLFIMVILSFIPGNIYSQVENQSRFKINGNRLEWENEGEVFWMDEAEPEIDPLDYENVRYYLGNGLEVSKWKDALSGKIYKGGQTIEYKVSIENIPVFTRNGSNFKLK